MSGRIHKLSPDVVAKICAGEVVDSPANVLKEVIENSLDAGSRNIIINLVSGGKTLIEIIDDGRGIDQDDIGLVFEDHSSSKIEKFDDLMSLTTFGFRGEALFSIAQVAKVILLSKTNDAKSGSRIESDFGRISTITNEPFQVGTKVSIYNLYEKIPARLKFLGSDQSEFRKIQKILYPMILARNDVSFTIYHNEKLYLKLSAKNSYIERYLELFSQSRSDFIEFETPAGVYGIRGFLNQPDKTISPANLYIYVNGRYISSSPVIIKAIKQAYHRLVPNAISPSGCIYIDLPTSEIDVNVHPKKLDIAFEKPKEVFLFIYRVIKKGLEDYFLKNSPKIVWQKQDSDSEIHSDGLSIGDVFEKKAFEEMKLDFNDSDNLNIENYIEPVAQLFDCFIVAKSGDSLLLFDQHTVHERILFDKFMTIMKSKAPESQALLEPEIVSLDPQKIGLIKDNIEMFENLGFDIEIFGDNQILVRQIPSILSGVNLSTYLEDTLIDLNMNIDKELEKKVAYMACRGAIKAGKKLLHFEQVDLLSKITDLKTGYTCPHGRPLYIKFTLLDLEKLFGRK